MKHKLILIAFIALTCISSVTVYAQKSPSAKPVAKPEKCTTNFNKLIHERVKPPYWGPGTYFAFAPGKSEVCKFDNDFSTLLDMLGNETKYFYQRIVELGHKPVTSPKAVEKRFQKRVKNTNCYFMFNGAPDTLLYIGESENIYENNQEAMVNLAVKIWYIPLDKKEEVVKTIWRYLNIAHQMNQKTSGIYVSLMQSAAKVDIKATYPQGFGTGSWKGICMPYMKTVFPEGFGKPGYNGPGPNYELYNYQDILRANLTAKGFYTELELQEADFLYQLNISLQKEGYLCELNARGKLMDCLPPGNTWAKHIHFVREDFTRWKNGDKDFEKGMNMINASIRPKPILLEEVLKYKAP